MAGGRRAVRKVGVELGNFDPERRLPWAWCRCCGAEVYIRQEVLCPRCRERSLHGEKKSIYLLQILF